MAHAHHLEPAAAAAAIAARAAQIGEPLEPTGRAWNYLSGAAEIETTTPTGRMIWVWVPHPDHLLPAY